MVWFDLIVTGGCWFGCVLEMAASAARPLKHKMEAETHESTKRRTAARTPGICAEYFGGVMRITNDQIEL